MKRTFEFMKHEFFITYNVLPVLQTLSLLFFTTFCPGDLTLSLPFFSVPFSTWPWKRKKKEKLKASWLCECILYLLFIYLFIFVFFFFEKVFIFVLGVFTSETEYTIGFKWICNSKIVTLMWNWALTLLSSQSRAINWSKVTGLKFLKKKNWQDWKEKQNVYKKKKWKQKE